jgi:hypothetical protein
VAAFGCVRGSATGTLACFDATMLRRLLALLGLAFGAPLSIAAAAEPLRELAYGKDAPEQRLDLYLPDAGSGKPPLVAFVSSRFWSREAGRHGYDAGRIFLAGHSSGAQIAGLLALDPEFLRRAEVDPARIAGVIAISGVHDLDPEEALPAELEELVAAAFGGSSARRAASPIRAARAEAPPFLVLAGGSDVPGVAGLAAALAEALRAAGAPAAEAFVASGRDHLTILDLADEMNPARAQVLGFVGLGPDAEEMREFFAGRSTWRDPPFSTEPFFALGAKIVSFEPDERFLRELNRPFAGRGGAGDRCACGRRASTRSISSICSRRSTRSRRAAARGSGSRTSAASAPHGISRRCVPTCRSSSSVSMTSAISSASPTSTTPAACTAGPSRSASGSWRDRWAASCTS